MSSIATENLEERIERIRKRTEEIEKKHRAAEEDRLMALMDNAMVKTKPPNDEDWPKAHKYDKLDFTYDIKPEKIEENNEQKQQQLIKPKRDYKKFAEGEGPPPDPIYNFLADAERDGIILQQKEQQQLKYNNDKKDLKQNQLNNNSNGRHIDNNKNKDQFNKRGGNGQQSNNNNNNSFRNRGNNNTNNGKSQQNNRYQKQNSQTDKQNLQPEQWRSEKIDDNNKLNNRQKMNNIEKWRRGDWDNNDKNNSNDLHNNKSPKHNTNNKNYYQHHNNNQQLQQNISNNIYTTADDIIEKRGNIMVSVSPGEVKSVKLTSAQVIGSGRVGPRQLTKPQFHIQTMEKEQQQQEQQIIQNISVPISPRPQINSGQQQLLNNFNNQQQQHNNNNNHNNYQQYATKNSIPPTQRQHQTTTQPQLNININNGISLAPKSPIKDKKNSKSPKYISPQQQQQKPILPNLMPIVGGGDNILKSPISSPLIVNNMVNNLLNNTTANTIIGGAGISPISSTITNADINVPEIDVKVFAVAKELSNKPEFAKKSVQHRLLRIRPMSQPDVVSLSSNDVNSTQNNNNNIVDQLININNNDNNLNATLLIKDANKDEQNDSIKNVETIVACN